MLSLDHPAIVFLVVISMTGFGLHSWLRVVDLWRGRKFDPGRYVTHQQLRAIREERDQQIGTIISDIKSDVDRIEKKINELDLAGLHRALGTLEGMIKSHNRRH